MFIVITRQLFAIFMTSFFCLFCGMVPTSLASDDKTALSLVYAVFGPILSIIFIAGENLNEKITVKSRWIAVALLVQSALMYGFASGVLCGFTTWRTTIPLAGLAIVLVVLTLIQVVAKIVTYHRLSKNNNSLPKAVASFR